MTISRGLSGLWESVLSLPLWQGIRARLVWLLATGLLVAVVGVSGILAWEYTNSTTFCGTQCHTMPPEYVAYTGSLHARVSCVDCHIGRVGFFKSAWLKSGHGGHLTSLIFDNYERPIRIKSLRPARETCELCHWPEAFYEDRVQEIQHFAPDENNSLSTTFLIMRTGGGLSREGRGRGIHWHIENKVEFVATDKEELNIPWVRVTDSQGEVTECIDSTQGWAPDMLDEASVQVMECLDCHNRNAHLFRSPDSSLDEALRTDQIDSSLPFVKAKGLELLQAEYSSLDEARAAIKGLTDYYRENHPQVYEAKGSAIQQAVRAITTILEETVFSNQAVGWSTYPNHQGHKDFPGCFRCHDGKHRTTEGDSIRLHCNICHSVPVVLQPGEEAKVEELGKRLLVAEEPPSHLASNFIADHRFQAGESCRSCHGAVEFGSDDSSSCSNSTCHGVEWPEVQLDAEQVHPMPLEGRHAELWCQDCHQDERKPDDACASCHQRPHDWGDETCDACHLLDGWVPARSGQGARTGPSPCEGDAGDTARLWSRVVTREEMDLKRIACVSLCLLLFVAALMACTPVPIEISPAPAHPDVTLEEWAARYPNEYRDWEDSVHGTAYLAGDPDAPGCTDCHGDPETGEIQTAAFRLGIPARCARCHADEDIMSRHDLPSDTYATFVADDYHGKTVAYYWHNDPTVWRYEAVCSDCHLSHAVYGPDDPKSSVSEANLLDTCQKCHLGATPNFVDFASGHFRWSRMGAPLVHYVSLAYRILIPLVIGLMLAYIGLDIYHRLRSRFGRETS